MMSHKLLEDGELQEAEKRIKLARRAYALEYLMMAEEVVKSLEQELGEAKSAHAGKSRLLVPVTAESTLTPSASASHEAGYPSYHTLKACQSDQKGFFQRHAKAQLRHWLRESSSLPC